MFNWHAIILGVVGMWTGMIFTYAYKYWDRHERCKAILWGILTFIFVVIFRIIYEYPFD